MFSLFRRAPRLPVYSELGTRFYRSLTEDEDEWRLVSKLVEGVYLWNPRHRIRIGHPCYEVYADYKIDGQPFRALLTEDDRVRVWDAVCAMFKKFQEHGDAPARIRRAAALGSFVGSESRTIDPIADALASAVKSGDMVAAKVLADRIHEIVNG